MLSLTILAQFNKVIQMQCFVAVCIFFSVPFFQTDKFSDSMILIAILDDQPPASEVSSVRWVVSTQRFFILTVPILGEMMNDFF